MVIVSKGGTYRESHYNAFGTGVIPSTYHTNGGIMYSHKGTMHKIPFVSFPYTLKFKYISNKNKAQIYINDALKATLDDFDISGAIGKNICSAYCASWTACSCY